MRIIFFGSSDFAVPVLEALKKREEIVLVVTQPDRKKSRSLKLSPTPVRIAADRLGIKTIQPDRLNCADSIEYLKRFSADIFVVVSFGQILNKSLLDIPRVYSINVHASLLPKYRGPAPINWALANGENQTGITIIKMNEKIDEGEIILKEAFSIGDRDDAITLSRKLSNEGCRLLLASIDLIKNNAACFLKQDDSIVTYAPKLNKEDGLIDWRWGTNKIYNRIRGFIPWPGCFTYWNKKNLKIWKAMPVDSSAFVDSKPGTVVEFSKKGILVTSGDGALRIEELQLEGRRRMRVEEFIAGRHKEMASGVVFSLRK